MRQREEYTQRQMDLLQSLISGVMLQGEAATKREESDNDVKVSKLTEEDDILAYLTRFGKLVDDSMHARKIEESVNEVRRRMTGQATGIARVVARWAILQRIVG